MTPRCRFVGLIVILAICSVVAGAGSLETYTFTITEKNWVQIPEQYQQPTPPWKTHVGSWVDRARHQEGNLYLHRIDKFGWRYRVKDDMGRIFILYAGQDWSLSAGTMLIISGTFTHPNVFIPQGERHYGR